MKHSQSSMELTSIIESILFAHGEPISIPSLAKLAEAGEEDTRQALARLKETSATRGLTLIEHQGSVQLVTRPEAALYIKKLTNINTEEPLTRAALETLAVIAYRGPLSRATIEHIRGVNSTFILRNLLIRGLIEKVVHPDDKRTNLYQTTFDFLRYLGITSQESLPEYQGVLAALKTHETKGKEATPIPQNTVHEA